MNDAYDYQQQAGEELQQRLEEALKHAEEGKCTPDDIHVLAWGCGITYTRSNHAENQ